MQEVSPAIGDLRADGSGALLVSSTLSFPQSSLVLAVDARGLDGSPVAQSSERLQAEINPNLAATGGQVIGYFAGESCIPASTRILNKGAAEKLSLKGPVLPEPEALLEIANAIVLEFQGAGNVGNPSKSPTRSKAGAKPGTFAMLVARPGELAADQGDGIRVQSQFSGTACAEFAQVNPRQPAIVQSAYASPLGFSLSRNEEIPDLITLDREGVEALTACAVFDAILESRDTAHGSVLSYSGPIKNASRACKPSGRSPFIPQPERRFLPSLKAGVSAPAIP